MAPSRKVAASATSDEVLRRRQELHDALDQARGEIDSQPVYALRGLPKTTWVLPLVAASLGALLAFKLRRRRRD